MLRLSKKADYGLMAMKHLAEHAHQAACSAKDVADAYSIPPEVMAKILQRLVKAGLLHSQHGTYGGYKLAREPGDRRFEVIRAIDGPLFITSCMTVRGECDQTERCTIREPLRRVNQSIEDVLRSINISEMRDEAGNGRNRERQDSGVNRARTESARIPNEDKVRGEQL